MSVENSRLILEGISDLQRELHGELVPMPIASTFMEEFTPMAWHDRPTIFYNSSGENQIITYTIPQPFHRIISLRLLQDFPVVKVKEEYADTIQIAWSHRPGLNILKSFRMDVGTYQTVHLDGISIDLINQQLRCNVSQGVNRTSERYINQYKKRIGSIPSMENWSESLPSMQTILPIPIPYDISDSKSFPLALCYDETKEVINVSFILERRSSITDLLRMRQFVEGQWKEIPVDTNYINCSEGLKFSVPRLAGEVVLHNEAEHCSLYNAPGLILWTWDVVSYSPPGLYALGDTVEVPIKCKSPCTTVMFTAHNRLAAARHNFSNYTTDSVNVQKGFSPIHSASLVNRNAVIFEDMTYEHLLARASDQGSAPYEEGTISYTFCRHPFYSTPGIGQTLEDARLRIRLEDSNPASSLEEKDSLRLFEEANIPKSKDFGIEIRLIVTKKITFIKKPDGTFKITVDTLNL
jgi:hypothetical protein